MMGHCSAVNKERTQYEWVSETLGCVNKARCARVHTVWFHFYNVLKLQRAWEGAWGSQLTVKESKRHWWDDIWIWDDGFTRYAFVAAYWTLHLKWVHFIACISWWVDKQNQELRNIYSVTSQFHFYYFPKRIKSTCPQNISKECLWMPYSYTRNRKQFKCLSAEEWIKKRHLKKRTTDITPWWVLKRSHPVCCKIKITKNCPSAPKLLQTQKRIYYILHFYEAQWQAN